MYQRSIELTVGLFVMAGIIALGYLSIQLGGVDFFSSGTYGVKARFSTVSGLRVGASVEMSGVRIGRVQTIGFAGEDAVITLRLDESVKLSRDSIASILCMANYYSSGNRSLK